MYAHSRRGGPMRSTPASVQCQKCLKRDTCAAFPKVNLKLIPSSRHYSYECKASAQDRPYVPRPSRSQQLRNPKLVPKLTNDALQPLEKKKGVADEEIAKRETQRAQKREREDREDDMIRSSPRRPISVSSSSISTISTSASAEINQPRGWARSSSPLKRERGPQAAMSDDRRPRGRSYSCSPPPPRGRPRPSSQDSRSPPPDNFRRPYRSRDGSSSRGNQDDREYGSLRRGRDDGARDNGGDSRSKEAKIEEPPRTRSLSPFSRRLAMTKGMNGGR